MRQLFKISLQTKFGLQKVAEKKVKDVLVAVIYQLSWDWLLLFSASSGWRQTTCWNYQIIPTFLETEVKSEKFQVKNLVDGNYAAIL